MPDANNENAPNPALENDPTGETVEVAPVQPSPMKAKGKPVDEGLMTDDFTGSGGDKNLKRVSRRALFIGFGLMAIVFAFFVYEFSKMGEVMGGGAVNAPVSSGSLDMARQMTDSIQFPVDSDPVAVIPEERPPEPPPPPPAIPQQQQPAPRLRQLSMPVQQPGPDPFTMELMRLEQVRQKQFEAAITGAIPVGFDAAGGAGVNPYTPPAANAAAGASGGRSGMIQALDAEIARADKMLADYGSDPNAIFQRQMAAIQAGNGFNPNQASLAEEDFDAVAPAVAAAPPVFAGNAMSGTRGNSLGAFDGDSSRWSLPSTMENPSQFMIRAGSVIPAVLLSAISSDLPGQILAQVSQDVYDTATGRYLLIPQGTRLIGGYSSEILYGQNRLFVAWQRLVFPDGRAYDIGAQPGTTGAGQAGLRDRVNYHLVRLFGSALLMSAVVGGVSYSQDRGSGGGYGGYGNGEEARTGMSSAMSEALGQNMGQVVVEMIRRNMNIAPTIEIRPGFRMNVMLIKDLAFRREYKSFDYRYANR